MSARLISSQAYINDEIVSEKSEAQDYTVQVSPVFAIDGQEVRYVIDGNHSLQAALIDGVDPELEEYDASDYDAISYLDDDDIDGFIDAIWDSALYFADDDTMVF
jgi:hypothetical protein